MHMDEAPTHRASEQHGAWFSFRRLGGFGPPITANKSMPSADERPGRIGRSYPAGVRLSRHCLPDAGYSV